MNHLNRDAILGFIVIAIIGIGAIWYVATRPQAPKTASIATTTPSVVVGPAHIIDHGQYYDVDTQYPSTTALAGLPDSADVNAVALMKQWEIDTIAQFKTDGNFANLTPEDIQVQGLDQGRKYSLAITYQTYTSPHTVTYVFQIFEDTLGAHPNTTYKTFTFDLQTGQNLSLVQIFSKGANYPATLSTLARAKIPPYIAGAEQVDISQVDMDMVNAGTTADAVNFQDFYFDGSNFVLLFPPYAVGPYVLGLVTISTPASEVLGLNPQYP